MIAFECLFSGLGLRGATVRPSTKLKFVRLFRDSAIATNHNCAGAFFEFFCTSFSAYEHTNALPRLFSESCTQRQLISANTKQMDTQVRDLLRAFVAAHSSVRDLQDQLKAAKTQRKALEHQIAPLLAKHDLQMIDIDQHRLYRYENRLVPYHLQTQS